MAENKNVKHEENVEENEAAEKGALASTMIFVGGFIFALYIAIYWLYMIRVDI